MSSNRRRTQVGTQTTTETASTLAATYRAMISRLEAGEQTAEVEAQLHMARRLLAIAER